MDTTPAQFECLLPKRTWLRTGAAARAVAARIYGALSGVWFWCAQSGAEPLIVGDKADLCDSIGESFDAVTRSYAWRRR